MRVPWAPGAHPGAGGALGADGGAGPGQRGPERSRSRRSAEPRGSPGLKRRTDVRSIPGPGSQRRFRELCLVSPLPGTTQPKSSDALKSASFPLGTLC